ncbi:MAG: TrkH family potassium uptake protein [Ruminococcaceae bacterium]|nr:TrkH family potassium uptake protein [Oscillospiraceae bacterium]
MNYRMILYMFGSVLKIESFALIVPFVTAICYKEQTSVIAYLICIALCFCVGKILTLFKPKSKEAYAKEGFITVALSWIIISIFGAFPFMITGHIPSFANAFFETVSGFTTTGASILKDVEALPKAHLMWRSFTHWLGGMGVLVFVMAVTPLFGKGSIHILKAESPGPSVSKLVPKVKSTAILLYGIYFVMTLVEIVLLLFGKMTLFEALTLSFGTAGTGGFSVLNSGISTYSPYIQYVITIFMILFGVNFSLYFILYFRERKSDIFKSEELRAYLGIIAAAIILIFINSSYLFKTVEEAFRHIAFSVGSIITTTGYTTCDFNIWPEFSRVILVLLMFIGACAGSTGGGIKVSRIIILLKSIKKEIRTTAHPRTTLKIKMNGRIIDHETVRGVNVFMASYVTIFMMALLIISIDNFNFTTNFTAVAATLNNIGPGLDLVGPTGNFSLFSDLSKYVLSMCMLIGRLEIFPMLLLFSPSTWRK